MSLTEIAEDYVKWDPNAETSNAIATLLKSNNVDELQQRLGSRLVFGTAGLRGPMGAGYNKMNDLVVLQTTQGLVKYLDHLVPDAKSKGVVIGYDHRALGTLTSKGFARISASVLLDAGYKVYLLENYVATPFVAFGVSHLSCAAGIMVTASHNPKQDNGFKLYWGNGSQIIPPHDTGIAASIAQNLKPWKQYDTSAVESHPLAIDVTDVVTKAYYASFMRLSDHAESNNQSSVKAVYTAMHGVGCQWVVKAFEAFNHPALDPVPSQAFPDASFPTVVFPNPEEKGALNESMAYAESRGATLIIANDPDADRLALAELNDGKWYVFSGNEIGVLLGHWQILRWKQKHAEPAAVLASVVSSRMLKSVAKAEGLIYQDTLTGFKWLGDSAITLRASGTPVLFTYEEALGYCVGDVLCDKDGISAACVVMEMATELARDGKSVKQHLQSLYEQYGEFVSYNSYVISHDSKVTDAIFARLREGGPEGGYWTECAGQCVVSIIDVTKGYDSTSADHKSILPLTPESHMIMFEFDNGCSVTLRTSGTEPKIKFYTEIAGKQGQARAEVDAVLHAFVDKLVDEMLQPDVHGLARA
jgi:phosphoglucomutase/phosphopentomutase